MRTLNTALSVVIGLQMLALLSAFLFYVLSIAPYGIRTFALVIGALAGLVVIQEIFDRWPNPVSRAFADFFG